MRFQRLSIIAEAAQIRRLALEIQTAGDYLCAKTGGQRNDPFQSADRGSGLRKLQLRETDKPKADIRKGQAQGNSMANLACSCRFQRNPELISVNRRPLSFYSIHGSGDDLGFSGESDVKDRRMKCRQMEFCEMSAAPVGVNDRQLLALGDADAIKSIVRQAASHLRA